jgi:hypothetical protein
MGMEFALVRIVLQMRPGAGTSTDDNASIAVRKNTLSFEAMKGPGRPYLKCACGKGS